MSINDYGKRFVPAAQNVSASQKCKTVFKQNILEDNNIPVLELDPLYYIDKFFFKVSDIGDIDKLINQYVRITKNRDIGDISDTSDLMRVIIFYYNIIRSSNDFYQKLENYFMNVKYIGPLRDPANRSYERGSYNYVGVMGEHAVQILANDSKLKDDVEKSFGAMDIADTFKISGSSNEKNFEFRVKTKITDDGVNFADIGCGTSQILPIIVQSLMPNKESLIIIEQPELHLHPRVQASLADFFIKIASERQKFLF